MTLDHPGGAAGYRVDYEGRSVTYVTDTELGTGKSKPNIVALARRTDLLIIDATYTDAELPSHRGWGHSTFADGVELALAAGVETLVLFHHEPRRSDEELDQRTEECRALVKRRGGTLQVVAAAEGLTLTV